MGYGGMGVCTHPLSSLEKMIPACSWVDGLRCKVLLALPYTLADPQHIVGNNQRENPLTKELCVTLISSSFKLDTDKFMDTHRKPTALTWS